MRRAAILLTLIASLAHGAEEGGVEQTLTLPHPLEGGGHVWLQVQVGSLAAGQRVRITTPSGELLGTISPFGRAARSHAGVYSMPIPPDAIHNGVLSVVVTVTEAMKPARAPTPAEVQSLKLLPPGAAQ